MDLGNITLAGLAAIGAVNVLTLFKEDIDSRIKFLVSLVVAFVVLFVPVELGNIILQKVKDALEVAFAASGTYKLAQKIGNN